MPAVPISQIFGWNTNVTYSKWDPTSVQYPGMLQYFFSTVDSNIGANPNSLYVYAATGVAGLSSTRQDNVTRLTFLQTGTTFFQQGSVVSISNMAPDNSVNYTGLVLAAGSGYVDYMNPGLNTSNNSIGGTIRAPIHPYWTTGFFWIPSWSTEATVNMQVIQTKLGEGYEQRMNPVINSNNLSWNLVFAERTDRETMGMLTFLQVAGGATPFYLNFPVGNIYPAANLKYISGPPRQGFSSFGLNQTTLPLTQVFDI